MSGIRRVYPRGPVTDPSVEGAALLVCGHGSGNGGDPLPERLRASAEAFGFAEVAGAFLYGKPSPEEAIAELRARPIFLVPNFLSAGTTLEALCARVATMSPETDIVMCPPLGAHPGLPRRVLETAREAAVCRGWAPAETSLLLIGHGSQINGASREFMHRLCATVRTGALFGEVETAFLSEEPGVDTALANLQGPQLVAIGCFAASGRHAVQDVPALLARSDRPMYYSGAIGEAHWSDQLILEQALRGVECRMWQGPNDVLRVRGV